MLSKKNIIKIIASVLVGASLIGWGASSKLAKSEYVDGVYTARAKNPDNQGWQARAIVTIENGEITEVSYDYTSEDSDVTKVNDDAYNARMLSIVGVNPKIYSREFAVEIITKQGLDDFDGVSGASSSTKRVQLLVGKILENAKKGNTELIIVDTD